MNDSKPSFTAAWVAGCRALATFLPDEVRVATDRYGERFCGPHFTTIFAVARRAPRLRPLVLTPMMPWVAYMQVRTRAIDDVLLAFVNAGGRQVVILGAGFDCRAARFADELGATRVFEVDHPSTQERKRAAMAAERQAPVTYVPWNFETRPVSELPDELSPLGLDPAAKTLVIWEGVTMYLSERAIDETLAAVRRLGAPGSPLVFNYMERSRIARPTGATRIVASFVARIGEPHVFGWEPAELPAWLTGRGFRLESDHTDMQVAEVLAPHWRPYLKRVNSHIAVARTTA